LGELYKLGHQIIGGLLPANNFYFALYDQAAHAITFPYSRDEYDLPEDPEQRYPIQEWHSLTSYLMEYGKPLLVDQKRYAEMLKNHDIIEVGADSAEWLGVPMKTVDGKVIGALVVQSYDPEIHYQPRDVEILNFVSTQVAMAIERKQTTVHIQESEIRFRSIFEQSYDGIILVDEYSKVIGWNKRMEEISGVAANKVIGSDSWVVLAKINKLGRSASENQIFHENDLREYLQTGQAEWLDHLVEIRVPFADGGIHIVEQAAFAIHTSRGHMLGIIVRDVTQMRLTEEDLRRSEERMRKYFDLPLIGIAITSKEMRWLEVNDKLCDILGYTRKELADLTWADISPIDEQPAEIAAFNRYVSGETDGATQEKRYTHCAGKLIDVEVSSLAVRKQDGGLDYVISLVQDISEKKRSRQQIHSQLQRMAALRSIDSAINSVFDLRTILDTLLMHVVEQLGVDAADVLLLNQFTQTLEFQAGRGFRTSALRHTRLRVGEGYAGQAAWQRSMVHVTQLDKNPQDLLRAPMFHEEGFSTYFGLPLIAKGQVVGVLEIFHRAHLDPDDEWISFLESIAGQTAIAIDNTQLFDQIQRTNMELSLAYDNTLEGWAHALELRDYETQGHSRRVTDLTVKLAEKMGLRGDELLHVQRGALLHDIGKLAISDTILLKPGPLGTHEWEVVRKHPQYAFEMLAPIHFLRPAVDIPYSHHEKWDGTGYPRGLKGIQIPLTARIFALVDVYDSLLHQRPYKLAWPVEKTLTYLRKQAGMHFDPDVVDTFMKMTFM
jgi:PAS domain S-box-containing protein